MSTNILKLICLSVLVQCITAFSAIEIYHKEGEGGSNLINPEFEIRPNSDSDFELSLIKVRYYFYDQNITLEDLGCDVYYYDPGDGVNYWDQGFVLTSFGEVKPPVAGGPQKANFYCELRFCWGKVPADGIASIEIAIHNVNNYDGHVFEEADDWSYANNVNFTLNDKMVIFDAMTHEHLFGVEPVNIIRNRQTDSLALVALYNSTYGEDWANNTNWLVPDAKIDTWFGLTVLNERVTQLELNDNLLNGTLPSEIGDLTKLLVLNCSGNMLGGAIPTQIGNLIMLQSIDLHKNLFNGTIPKTIENLTDLQFINFRENRLEGSIPSEIGNLSYLQTLDLRENEITGEIPESAGKLTNLQFLYLNNNNLRGSLPSSIDNLVQLTDLYLNDNELTDIPLEIMTLTGIVNLEVRNNLLCGISDASLITWLSGYDPEWNNFQNCRSTSNVFVLRNTFNEVAIELSSDGFFIINVPIEENETIPGSGGLLFKRKESGVYNAKAGLFNDAFRITGEKQSPFGGDFPATAISVANGGEKLAAISKEGDLLVRTDIEEIDLRVKPNMIKNMVSQVPGDLNPITTTEYYNGRLKNIQSQIKLTDTRSLIGGIYYNPMDKIDKVLKPFAWNTTTYKKMYLHYDETLTPLANAYHGNDTAYSRAVYDIDPLERLREAGAPGDAYSLNQEHHLKIWYFGIPGSIPSGDILLEDYFDYDMFIHHYCLNDADLSDIKTLLESYEPDYYLEVTLDPNGNYFQQIIDKYNQVVRTWSNPSKVYNEVDEEEIIREYFRYDDMGNLLEAVPPADNATPPNDIGNTAYKYNTAGQMLRETTPDAGNINIEYNDAGLVSTVTRADGTVLNYFYDRFMRFLYIVAEGNVCSRAFYDRVSKLSDISTYLKPEHVPAFEIIKTELHNLNGRQCGALSIEYESGAVDKEKCVVDLISYDSHGRVEAKYKYIPQVGWQKTTFEYNLMNSITQKNIYPQYLSGVSYPDIAFNYEYDNIGRLSFVKNAEGKELCDYTYTETGLLREKNFYNKTTQTVTVNSLYSYNIRDWLESVDHVAAGSDLFTEDPGYSSLYDGTISSETFNFKDIGRNITLSYTYDGINRLTSVAANSGYEIYSEAFKYDPIGRIKQRRRGSSTLEGFYKNNYIYNTGNNRLRYITDIHSTTDNYTWDANGNMLTDDSKKMQISYDWSHMKKTILLNEGEPDETEVTMVYDASGSRVLKEEKIGAVTHGVVYADNDMVFEDEGSGYHLSYVNIIGLSGVEGRIDYDGTVEQDALYYVKDRKGSTRAAVTEDGIVPKEYMYYAYGTVEDLVMSPSDDEPREKFTSKEFDTEGGMNLYYFGARYHDAEAGMFTSPDPGRQYWNLYSYTGGNPVMLVDPFGMEDETPTPPIPHPEGEANKEPNSLSPIFIMDSFEEPSKGEGVEEGEGSSWYSGSGGYGSGGYGTEKRTEYVTLPQEQNKGDDESLKTSGGICFEDPRECIAGLGDDGEIETKVPVPNQFAKKEDVTTPSQFATNKGTFEALGTAFSPSLINHYANRAFSLEASQGDRAHVEAAYDYGYDVGNPFVATLARLLGETAQYIGYSVDNFTNVMIFEEFGQYNTFSGVYIEDAFKDILITRKGAKDAARGAPRITTLNRKK